MSIASTLGADSLLQLGLSLGDLSILYHAGRAVGNWWFIGRADQDLLDLLQEKWEVLLQRKGVIEVSRMETRFGTTRFMHEGKKVTTKDAPKRAKQELDPGENDDIKKTAAEKRLAARKKEQDERMQRDLNPFSWLMVVIVSTLDICLSPDALTELIIDVFTSVLKNPEAEESLRVALEVNLESWRFFGIARGVQPCVLASFKRTWNKKTSQEAVPELNPAEKDEMRSFLITLMSEEPHDFLCLSASTFSTASAIQAAGVHINATRVRVYDTQLVVTYASGQQAAQLDAQAGPRGGQHRGVPRAQMVLYPANDPASMIQIHTTLVRRETINKMKMLWFLGAKAGDKFYLMAKSDYPYHIQIEPHYVLGGQDLEYDDADPLNSLIATAAFPCASQGILEGVRKLTEGCNKQEKEWLVSHTGREFLLRNDCIIPPQTQGEGRAMMDLWTSYQALVFGFYYQMFKSLVTLDFLSEEEQTAHFRGLWGYGSTVFLAMCTQFGQELRNNEKVDRTHVLYMLATIYGGRQKMYSGHARNRLLGVIGPVSILGLPLLQTTDDPQTLARYAVIDLPIVGLEQGEDGELIAGGGSGILFSNAESPPKPIYPQSSAKEWSVHATMRRAFRGGGEGVVMAVRSEGRLVGWFNPIAADTMFLSAAYVQKQHEDEQGYKDETVVHGFEVLDGDWQRGLVHRPFGDGSSFGVVHSKGCCALRYAAAGFYSECGEEVAVSTDDISVAFGRIEAQDSGVIIA